MFDHFFSAARIREDIKRSGGFCATAELIHKKIAQNNRLNLLEYRNLISFQISSNPELTGHTYLIKLFFEEKEELVEN